MPSKIRLNRIADRIRNELSSMLVTEVSDPRLGGIFVTDVKVDRELAYADIYVSAVEGRERSKEALEGLHSAAGYLRRALADRVDLRVFPRLRFHWDMTPERADQIERVLASLRDETSGQPDDEEAPLEGDETELDDNAIDEETLDELDELDELDSPDESPDEDDERD